MGSQWVLGCLALPHSLPTDLPLGAAGSGRCTHGAQASWDKDDSFIEEHLKFFLMGSAVPRLGAGMVGTGRRRQRWNQIGAAPGELSTRGLE